MARGKAKQSKDIKVETYTHKGKKRKNNPHVGLVSSATDKLNGRTKYKHDPHIDPALSWAGKAEGMSIEVQNVSLHIHERIDPKRIVKAFLKKKEQKQFQLDLFEQPDNEPPLNKAIDFYKHEQDWTNRLIAGDSLLVMNSLLKKEGMAKCRWFISTRLMVSNTTPIFSRLLISVMLKMAMMGIFQLSQK